MPITLDQPAVIEHINVRKEGAEGQKVLMVDLKLLARTSADILAEFDPTLRHMLFNNGEPRYPRMAAIKWRGESAHMELEILGLTLIEVRVHKFQLEPFSIHGQEFVDLTCLATFAPSGRDTAILAEQVGETVDIKLGAGPQLDLTPH